MARSIQLEIYEIWSLWLMQLLCTKPVTDRWTEKWDEQEHRRNNGVLKKQRNYKTHSTFDSKKFSLSIPHTDALLVLKIEEYSMFMQKILRGYLSSVEKIKLGKTEQIVRLQAAKQDNWLNKYDSIVTYSVWCKQLQENSFSNLTESSILCKSKSAMKILLLQSLATTLYRCPLSKASSCIYSWSYI